MDKKIGIILQEAVVNRFFLNTLLKTKDIGLLYFALKKELLLSDLEESARILGRIKVTENLKDLFSMDCIFVFIRNCKENNDGILQQLNLLFKGPLYLVPDTIQNTTSLLESKGLSNYTVLHFPDLSLKPFVEILPHINPASNKIKKSLDLLEYLGYHTIMLKKGVENDIIDRLQLSVIKSAILTLKDGFAVSTVDSCLKFRLGFSNGIFRLADCYGINKIYEKYMNLRLEVPPVIDELYRRKKFGKSTGTGFYDYSKDTTIIPEDDIYKLNPYDLISPVINKATELLAASDFDFINKFFTFEYGLTRSIFAIADGIGINNIVKNLDTNYNKHGDSLFLVASKLMEMINHKNLGVTTGSGFYKYKYSESDFGPVKYYTGDGYAYIVMNRPEALNALNEEMWEGLKLAIEKGNSDGNVISIIITGTGRSFSAGDDISMMAKWNGSIDASIWLDKYANPLIDKITSSIKPIISIVDGIAFGGGCELNMLFDIVIASNRSIFSVPEGLIGALPPVASSYGLALTGRKLFRYLLTSEWINASQAKELGFVDIVASPEQLPFLIYEFTEKIRRNAPMSIASTKRLINGYKETFKSLERLAGSYLVINAGSEDFKNGQKAFLNKEKIEWRGK